MFLAEVAYSLLVFQEPYKFPLIDRRVAFTRNEKLELICEGCVSDPGCDFYYHCFSVVITGTLRRQQPRLNIPGMDLSLHVLTSRILNFRD